MMNLKMPILEMRGQAQIRTTASYGITIGFEDNEAMSGV
jgi:hypothetical protein